MKIKLILDFLFLIFLFNLRLFGQELKRDTSLFNEHQVVFEKMDYVPTKQVVKIDRHYKDNSVTLQVTCDPYWISSLVSNKEYNEYLKSIKNDSTIEFVQKASPKKEICSQRIDGLNIILSEYFANPKYEYYPVLGISFNQALEFCKWKTNQVNKELEKVNLPHEKIYRLPGQAEIELVKRYMNINLPKISKVDTTYSNKELVNFNSRINELTNESFIDSTYLTELSEENNSEQIVIYQKSTLNNVPYEKRNTSNLHIGFRYAQTYRKVKNSK